MDDNKLPKKIIYKPEGRRNIGRLQTRWEMISGRKEQAKGLSLIDDDDSTIVSHPA